MVVPGLKTSPKVLVPARIESLAAYGFLLLLPFSLFWPISRPPPNTVPAYLTPGLYLSDIAVAALFISFGLFRRSRRIGPVEIAVPLMGLPLIALLTSPFALSPGLALYTAFRWAIAIAVYVWFVRSHLSIKHMVLLFAGGLSVHALVGLLQVIYQQPLGLPGELTLPIGTTRAAIVELGSSHWLRAYGLTFHPNVLGGYMVVGLLLSLPLLSRRTVWIVWLLLWLGLFLSFSRSAWLAAALTMPVAIAWLARRRPELRRCLLQVTVSAAFLMLLCGLIWHDQLAVRIRPAVQVLLPQSTASKDFQQAGNDGSGAIAVAEARSLRERREHIKIASSVLDERALVGIGSGNFPLLILKNDTALVPEYIHNVTLLLASEVGVLGGGAWLALTFFGFYFLARQWNAGNLWAVPALCAWLALVTVSLFDSYPWALNAGRLLTVMVLGTVGRSLENG